MLAAQLDLSDGDEAVAALESSFPGIRLGASADAGFFFRLDGHLNKYGLSYLHISIGGRHMSTRVEDTAGLMVTTAESITGEMTDAGVDIDHAQPYVTRAGLRSEYSFANCHSIALDKTVMEAHLRKRAGTTRNGPFRFTGVSPKSAQHAATWSAIATTVETAMRTGLADDPLLGVALTDMVAAGCLAVFPNNWVDRDHPPRSRSTAAVRRATTFIEEHAHEPVAVHDIAEAARLSPRGLQSAFRSQTGVTPMAYLRQVRLQRARNALLAADPAERDSVAVIARAAGFGHLSRFAAAYRALHGEYPHETLRA